MKKHVAEVCYHLGIPRQITTTIPTHYVQLDMEGIYVVVALKQVMFNIQKLEVMSVQLVLRHLVILLRLY
jgi:hypothetical protein